jgi:hypothetical protein
VETVEFFPHRFKLPFPSSSELATQAAADLKHALLNPQPAGPSYQVGDEQVIALRRLANIFGAAKLKSGKEKLTPQDKVESYAPQRVRTTVSPPRVTSQNPDQTSLQEIISPHSTPNSHRRQQTPHRRVVTPQTPHGMVRRSARHHNLSQDMMAETLAQANHCFSISANTKINHPSTPKTESVILPEVANAVICPETGKSLKHHKLITKLKYKIQWMRSTANEINRLYNTNTIRFIRRADIPKGRKVTYGSFVVDIKDHKEEKERTPLTVGGDQNEYPGDKSTRTEGLTTAKILVNSVISTQGAKFLVIDIKNFYLNTPLGQFEYMVINLASLPQETIEKYDLNKLAQDRKVYIEIQKGMYGFPQAGILANELLQRNLAKDGYRPTTHTHGLWTHDTCPISFSLVVDDFGVKYVGWEHAEHLMASINKNYNISNDWNGTAYCGLTLDWNYQDRIVVLSMPGYIKAALHKYQNPAPARPEHSPHTWNSPIYGAKTQFVSDPTPSPAISDKDVNKLQQLTGTFLYYARAADPTLLIPINILASEQSNATEVTADKVIKLLNYCNTHPETKIRYHASDMIYDWDIHKVDVREIDKM